MGSEWQEAQITDLYDISSGLSKPAKDFGSGHPFLAFKDVFNNFFIPDELTQLVQSNEQEQKNGSIRRGDVFLTRTSETMHELGMSSVALKDYDKATFNGFTKRLRPKDSKTLVPEFVGYYLRSPQFRNEMLAFSTMSTRASLNNEMISRLKISFPSISEQKSIGLTLKKIDDKIELNRRMNGTLESMAQALFKSWFVDFDPVIDNALASGKEIPAELSERAAARAALGDRRKALPAEIRTLFPDEFTDSAELGWIPKGWEVAQIRDIATNPRRVVHAENIKSGTPYIGLQDMPQKSIALSSWGQSDEVASSKFEFHRGEILFGKLRPYFHKVGIAPVDGVCSTDILIVLPKKDEWLSVVFGHVTSVAFIEYVTAASTGTKMPRTNWKDMGSYSVVLPDKSLAKILTEQFEQNIAKILFNIEQSRELAKLRDTLLPKLLSGEVRIPDAEKMVEELAL